MNKSMLNIDAVKAATAAWAARNGYGAEGVELSDRAKAVAEAIGQGGFGGYDAKVRELMGALLGETLPRTVGGVDFEYGVIVVPTGNSNQHSYPLEQPVLMTSEKSGLRLDGSRGNNMEPRRENVRPATPAEIDAYFAA